MDRYGDLHEAQHGPWRSESEVGKFDSVWALLDGSLCMAEDSTRIRSRMEFICVPSSGVFNAAQDLSLRYHQSNPASLIQVVRQQSS